VSTGEHGDRRPLGFKCRVAGSTRSSQGRYGPWGAANTRVARSGAAGRSWLSGDPLDDEVHWALVAPSAVDVPAPVPVERPEIRQGRAARTGDSVFAEVGHVPYAAEHAAVPRGSVSARSLRSIRPTVSGSRQGEGTSWLHGGVDF
jgi:hypothetical protein